MFISNKLNPKDLDGLSISETYSLPLICPITRKRLVNPARSVECSHLECFELESFISMKSSSCRWDCPICKKETSLKTLKVDKFIMRILAECNEEIVEINKDCSWKVLSKDKKSCLKIDDNFYDLTEEKVDDTIYITDDSNIENINNSGNQAKDLILNSRPALKTTTNNSPNVTNKNQQAFKSVDKRGNNNFLNKENQRTFNLFRVSHQNNVFRQNLRFGDTRPIPSTNSLPCIQENLTSLTVAPPVPLTIDNMLTTSYASNLASTSVSPITQIYNPTPSLVAPEVPIDKSICEICSRKFKSLRGKLQHQRISHRN